MSTPDQEPRVDQLDRLECYRNSIRFDFLMFSELDGFNQQKIKLLARDQQLTKLTVYIYIQ